MQTFFFRPANIKSYGFFLYKITCQLSSFLNFVANFPEIKHYSLINSVFILPDGDNPVKPYFSDIPARLESHVPQLLYSWR